MSHNQDRDESWALILLEGIILRQHKDAEAINDKAFVHIEQARNILKSIQNNPNQQNGNGPKGD
jgi:hypothetical protein